MMSITHACIATAGVSLILSTANPLALGLAVVGSQLPDLDTSTSLIGKVVFPVSHWLEDRFPHRSVTHSLLATAALAAVALPIGYFLGGLKIAAALPIGYFLGGLKIAAALPLGHLLACFSDTFTKQGVQLFWPEPAWAISVSNPKRRLTTGGPGEYWVLASAVAILVVGCYLAASGGLTQQVSLNLGMRDGLMQVYNQNAATHQVYLEFTGFWAEDRSRADGRYLILGTSGDSEFLVTDGAGVYKTGYHIIPEQMKPVVGESARTEIQTLTFNDQDAVAALQQLQALYPQAQIYLSGSVTVDFPEEVVITLPSRQLETASLSGATLTLNYHPLELAMLQLRDQYATGTLTARVIQLQP
jgi:inner membrane protein